MKFRGILQHSTMPSPRPSTSRVAPWKAYSIKSRKRDPVIICDWCGRLRSYQEPGWWHRIRSASIMIVSLERDAICPACKARLEAQGPA